MATAAETVVADPPGNGTGASKPVLEMLARPGEPDAPRDPSRAAGWILAGTLGAAALIAAAGFAGATLFGEDDSSSGGQGASEERHFTARGIGPLAAPFPSEPQAACYATAYVRRRVTLYRRPRGRKELRIAARTEWRSPRVLSVVRQDGDWLAVEAAELRNGQVGWMRRDQARVDCVRWSLKVDLSKRALFVRKNGQHGAPMTIAVGGPGHPTPKGASRSPTAQRRRQGLALRLLRPRAHRPPAQAAPGLARRRPARDPRDQRHGQHRQGGQPRLHADGIVPGTVADRDRAARHARIHPQPESHGRRVPSVLGT